MSPSTKTLLGALLALGCSAGPTIYRRQEDGLPGNCIYNNGIAFGVVPSDGPYDNVESSTYTISDINSKLGANTCAFGRYAQVSDASFSSADSQLTSVLDEAVQAGGVFQASVMTTLNPITDFTSDTAGIVASKLKQFTDQGVEVWLRFGHEMNYYAQESSGPTYHISDPSEFVSVWQIMYSAVSDNDMIKMWWSPNQDGNSDYDQYYPGSQYVDMVGIDCYPTSAIDDSSFANCYQDFYNKYASSSVPFAIGETGYCSGNGGSSSSNDDWLAQLFSQDKSTYPNYIAMSWYEYEQTNSNGDCDFRIIENGNLDATKQILFGSGSGSPPSGGGSTGGGNGTSSGGSGGSGSGSSSGSGSGSNGTTSAFPADTCTWGCEGWDCSSSSPCQSAYTCSNGICGDCTWGCNGWSCSDSSPCNADYSCVSGYCHHSGSATKR